MTTNVLKFVEIINTVYPKYAGDYHSDRKLEFRSSKMDYQVSIGCIFDISEIVQNKDLIENFLYDRKSQKFFCNVTMGYHFMLAEYILLWSEKFDDTRDLSGWYEDDYIEKGLGFILSSIKKDVFIGKYVVLTAQEKLVFNKLGLTFVVF